MFGWFKAYKRKKILAQPFPRPWQEILHDRIWQYQQLSQLERDKLHECTKVIVAEKSWEGCDGLEVTESMCVTIAGKASLMLLGTNDYYFDGVQSVLIFPRAFDRNTSNNGIYDTELRGGEAWQNGPIILSWDNVLQTENHDSAYNIVVHEFAHHLDGLDGEMGGTPIFDNDDDQRKWATVMAVEYEYLCAAATRGQWTILSHYGAKNKAEFFSVASECFFDTPERLKKSHSDLYELLRRFYRTDPMNWVA